MSEVARNDKYPLRRLVTVTLISGAYSMTISTFVTWCMLHGCIGFGLVVLAAGAAAFWLFGAYWTSKTHVYRSLRRQRARAERLAYQSRQWRQT